MPTTNRTTLRLRALRPHPRPVPGHSYRTVRTPARVTWLGGELGTYRIPGGARAIPRATSQRRRAVKAARRARLRAAA